MKATANLLRKYARNGVISLLEVKRYNYYLYRLWLNHREKLSENLTDVRILDDTRVIRDDESMKSFLLYHFGEDFKLKMADRALYMKLYYRAKKKGMTASEYIRYLGFDQEPDIVYLHDVKRLSFREISALTNIPKSTVHYKYKEAKKTG